MSHHPFPKRCPWWCRNTSFSRLLPNKETAAPVSVSHGLERSGEVRTRRKIALPWNLSTYHAYRGSCPFILLSAAVASLCVSQGHHWKHIVQALRPISSLY